eukprot:TRINITY_DN18636_c0_g1_i4.p1 TRINITY_DN18636_c0_g1~~TRINITY_DN18636_c0_g1_i4.p1  ORF type:complete len:232 (-),score=11.71 TRINITY_DN18636_c0_g1_i4:47-742(-)
MWMSVRVVHEVATAIDHQKEWIICQQEETDSDEKVVQHPGANRSREGQKEGLADRLLVALTDVVSRGASLVGPRPAGQAAWQALPKPSHEISQHFWPTSSQPSTGDNDCQHNYIVDEQAGPASEVLGAYAPRAPRTGMIVYIAVSPAVLPRPCQAAAASEEVTAKGVMEEVIEQQDGQHRASVQKYVAGRSLKSQLIHAAHECQDNVVLAAFALLHLHPRRLACSGTYENR